MSQTKAQLIDTLVASLLPASDSAVDIGSNAVRFANIYGDTLYGSGANLTGLNIVTDTSPQLGGTLDSNGQVISFPDSNGSNNQVRFGTGNDLLMYHQSNSSYIINQTGNLNIGSNNEIRLKGGFDVAEHMGRFIDNGAVELYYDASKKFETTSAGSTVTGALTINNAGGNAVLGQNLSLVDSGKVKCGNNDDLQISHDGTDSIINNFTGSLKFQRSGSTKILFDTNGDLGFVDSRKAYFGDGADLQIYHNGTNSFINNSTGYFNINSNGSTLFLDGTGAGVYLRVGAAGSEENAVIATPNGAVELYYDGSKKLHTTSTGSQTEGMHLVKGHSDIDNQFNPLLFLQDSTNTSIKAVFLLEDDYTTGRAALAINVGEAGVTNDRDLMLQKAGGRVGIRCAPTENFEVSGTSKFNGAVKLGDSNELRLGTGDDFKMYHDGVNSLTFFDTQVGGTRFRTNVGSSARSNIILGTGVDLYYDNSKKLETTSTGITVSGTEHKFTSGTSGDCKLIIEADTDNNDEDDNPLLIFRQDGELDLSVIGTGLTGSSSDNHLTLANSAANGGISFRTGTANGYTNAVERMRVLAQGGLTFNGDTSNNNALSDYEQGTWTATAEFNTGGFKSCSNNVCRYVKVGTLVHISGRFSLNNHTGASSGELRIEGLPFSKGNPSGDGNSDGICIYVEGAATNITNSISGLVLDNTTRFLIRRSGTTASGNDMAGKTDSGTTLLVGGTYTTFG